ncbi:MAG: SDR family NAD(P)-dependent oxidoreductase [Betaproteobacteria bacterium]|nr:SDR family NAD(P)-dependent oxidoreductase [Betaproteobacteria bacterium]
MTPVLKSTPEKPLLVIAGFGDGLGLSLARRFLDGGFEVAGIARTGPGQSMPGVTLYRADLADPEAAAQALRTIEADFGSPAVLVHNAAALVRGPFLELQAADFEQAWRSNVLTAFNTCRAAIPAMLRRGGGTLILSGATASLRGGARFAPFASAKFALRGLAQSLAREFQGQGVHVAHVVLDGILWSARSRSRFPDLLAEGCLNPDAVAETYWQLAHQPASAWTLELDLRPMTESF